MNYREVARKLTALGCHELGRHGKGSHRKWVAPGQGATIIPDWGSRDLKMGTVRAAVRQLGMDWRSFQDA